MTRYALAFALCLLVVPALAQTPNPAPTVEQLQTELQNARIQLRNIQAERANYAASLDQFKASVEQQNGWVGQLQSQLKTTADELTKKEKALADLQKQRDASRGAETAAQMRLNQQIASAKAEAAEKDKRIAALSQDLAAAKAELQKKLQVGHQPNNKANSKPAAKAKDK